MVGKANTNHDAKFITSPFWGNSLQKIKQTRTIRWKKMKKELVDNTVHLHKKLPLPNEYWYLLAHLSDQNQVGSSSSQSGGASNACSIADRQQETFTHPLPLLLYITQLLLLCGFHRYDHCDTQSVHMNQIFWQLLNQNCERATY